MPSVKTAISIEQMVFEDVNVLAKKLNVSRSYIFSQAAKEYLQKHKNALLLKQINEAYDDSGEDSLVEKMHAKHLEIAGSDKW